jgi:hypothetical protein
MISSWNFIIQAQNVSVGMGLCFQAGLCLTKLDQNFPNAKGKAVNIYN